METNAAVTTGRRIIRRCLLFECESSRQGGNPRLGDPLSPAFPIKDIDVMFEKIPPSGIFPSSLLKERFKDVKAVKLERNQGMVPEILWKERSKYSKLVSF
jgi:hypothetical protein